MRSADGEVKAAAMASIAGMVEAFGGVAEARCLREKRERKRLAKGTDSDVRSVRRRATVGLGDVMAMLKRQFVCFSGR